jgi:cytochrome c oxidase cbb3-type subunit 4
MKFINYIEKIAGVDVFGTVSLAIFTLFFAGVLIWVFKTKKKTFDEINRIPLDN